MNKRLLFVAASFVLTSSLLKAQDSTLTLSLLEARNYAVEHSYYTQQALMDEVKADKRVKETIGIGLPQIDGDVSFQNFLEIPTVLVPDFSDPTSGELLPAQFGTEYNLTAGLQVNQLIFDGSYIVGLQAANAYRDFAQKARVKSQQEIKDAITKAYANVMIADENLRTLQGNKDNLEKLLKETAAFQSEGFLEEQDVDQLRLLYQSAENALNNGTRARDISMNLLKFQLGVDLSNDVILTDSLESMLAYGNQREDLNKPFDYNAHFDYQLAESNQTLMMLNWRAEKATYLPGVYGFYQYQQQFQDNSFDLGNGDRWFPTQIWGLSMKVPIFSSGQRKFRNEQAQIDYEKAALQTKQKEQELIVNYLTASSNYTYAIDQYTNSSDNFELIERILNKEQIKYNQGVSSSLDLANVQIQFFELQGGYIQSILNLINAKSELDKALNNY